MTSAAPTVYICVDGAGSTECAIVAQTFISKWVVVYADSFTQPDGPSHTIEHVMACITCLRQQSEYGNAKFVFILESRPGSEAAWIQYELRNVPNTSVYFHEQANDGRHGVPVSHSFTLEIKLDIKFALKKDGICFALGMGTFPSTNANAVQDVQRRLVEQLASFDAPSHEPDELAFAYAIGNYWASRPYVFA